MRTLFDLSVRRNSWTPNIGSPLSMGQGPSASIADILKAAVTGAGSAATEYEKAQAAQAKAEEEAAKAQAAQVQARAATAVAASQNPTVLGMPPLVAGVVGLGIAGIIIALVATR